MKTMNPFIYNMIHFLYTVKQNIITCKKQSNCVIYCQLCLYILQYSPFLLGDGVRELQRGMKQKQCSWLN